MSETEEPMTLTRVCLIEDHADFREAMEEVLESSERFEICASLSNAEDAFEFLKESPAPEVVILDLGLPGMDGIEAISVLGKLIPDSKILVLTVFDNKARVFQALGAGADGYLIKSDGLEAIVKGIEDATHGISPLSSDIAKMVFDTFTSFKPAATDENLSSREVEVLTILASGSNRKDVAEQLGVSNHTINTHIRNIYKKLQVHNLSGATSRAVAMGII